VNCNLGTIIAAGGSGIRFGNGDKLLKPIFGQSVLLRAVRPFIDLCGSGNMVVACPSDSESAYRREIESLQDNGEIRWVNGGETRTRSVWNALQLIPEEVEAVAIHDAARPLLSKSLVLRIFDACLKHGAAAPGEPVTATLKKVGADGFSEGTVDRQNLWAIQTPQIFLREPLIEAYRKAIDSGRDFTDDTTLFESCGKRVFLVENLEPNPKITYPSDLLTAESILNGQHPER
jgi:2-C-methyl-D-erythritol 4-phosphate cytidylyltransferase